MTVDIRPKVLVTKIGFDGHDRGMGGIAERTGVAFGAKADGGLEPAEVDIGRQLLRAQIPGLGDLAQRRQCGLVCTGDEIVQRRRRRFQQGEHAGRIDHLNVLATVLWLNGALDRFRDDFKQFHKVVPGSGSEAALQWANLQPKIRRRLRSELNALDRMAVVVRIDRGLLIFTFEFKQRQVDGNLGPAAAPPSGWRKRRRRVTPTAPPRWHCPVRWQVCWAITAKHRRWWRKRCRWRVRAAIP